MSSLFFCCFLIVPCCIFVIYEISSEFLAPVVLFYVVSATLDILGTIYHDADTIYRRESSVSFRFLTKRLGKMRAVPIQICIEMILACIAAPAILGHSAPSVSFLLLASITHLYGFVHNYTVIYTKDIR